VILVSTLALVVVGSMLFIFYGQYRWLASGIVSSSVDQHYVSLKESFERQARGELHRIADSLSGLSPVKKSKTRVRRTLSGTKTA
jgi:hypothetical protein